MADFVTVNNMASAFRPYRPPPLAIPTTVNSFSLHPPLSSELSPAGSLKSVLKSTSSDSSSTPTSFGILENKRRKRTTFSTSQCSILEQEYVADRYMPREKRITFAKQLNLTESQVKTWFQNRRAKDKRERRLDISTPPSASAISTLPLSAGLQPSSLPTFPSTNDHLLQQSVSSSSPRPFSLNSSTDSSPCCPPLVETPPMVLPTIPQTSHMSTLESLLYSDPTSLSTLQALLSPKSLTLSPLPDTSSSLFVNLLPSLYDSLLPPLYSSPSVSLVTTPSSINQASYQF